MKVSVDIGFFNDRLRLQGELYDRRTRDAVTSVPVPYTTGFSYQSYNTSELLNQGAELTVSAQILKMKDWSASISANMAYNRNKLLKYSSPNGSIFNSNYVGYPLSSIVSGKVIGIDEKLGIYAYATRPDVTMSTEADRGEAKNYAFYLGTSNAPTNGGYSISLSYLKSASNLNGNLNCSKELEHYAS